MKSIFVLGLVSFLATLAGCAGKQVVQPAREVSVLALDQDQLRAMVPPGDEMEMQIAEPVKKEKKAAPELGDKVSPEKIDKSARKLVVVE